MIYIVLKDKKILGVCKDKSQLEIYLKTRQHYKEQPERFKVIERQFGIDIFN